MFEIEVVSVKPYMYISIVVDAELTIARCQPQA